jgi:hypothetical protein
MMSLYGGMAKGERSRIKMRVRSAMESQARHEGRFLGGRPPYGYQLADAGAHPNPAKTADGKRLHRLEIDTLAAPVVRRIFDEYLSGQGLFAIAEGLSGDRIPSPSAHDPIRNRHRQSSCGVWGKTQVRTILQNPRYTGHQVWNRQRRDEVLVDVEDVALGNTTKMRWNKPDQWVWSEQPVHEAIVSRKVFDRVQELFSRRARRPVKGTRDARRPYVLRGILQCAWCGRRMQGSYNNGKLHYRCRFPGEYATTTGPSNHPRNVYVRQDAIEPHLDAWLSQVFDPQNVDETRAALVAASQADVDVDAQALLTAKQTIGECDRRLDKYRKVLDEGGDPKTVAGWMADEQAKRQEAERVLASIKPRQTPTEVDVRRLFDEVEDSVKMLAEADPETKSALYAALGIRLTYDSDRKRVTVEAQPRSWGLGRVGGGT